LPQRYKAKLCPEASNARLQTSILRREFIAWVSVEVFARV
jgi:hypothetical protein